MWNTYTIYSLFDISANIPRHKNQFYDLQLQSADTHKIADALDFCGIKNDMYTPRPVMTCLVELQGLSFTGTVYG